MRSVPAAHATSLAATDRVIEGRVLVRERAHRMLNAYRGGGGFDALLDAHDIGRAARSSGHVVHVSRHRYALWADPAVVGSPTWNTSALGVGSQYSHVGLSVISDVFYLGWMSGTSNIDIAKMDPSSATDFSAHTTVSLPIAVTTERVSIALPSPDEICLMIIGTQGHHARLFHGKCGASGYTGGVTWTECPEPIVATHEHQEMRQSITPTIMSSLAANAFDAVTVGSEIILYFPTHRGGRSHLIRLDPVALRWSDPIPVLPVDLLEESSRLALCRVSASPNGYIATGLLSRTTSVADGATPFVAQLFSADGITWGLTRESYLDADTQLMGQVVYHDTDQRYYYIAQDEILDGPRYPDWPDAIAVAPEAISLEHVRGQPPVGRAVIPAVRGVIGREGEIAVELGYDGNLARVGEYVVEARARRYQHGRDTAELQLLDRRARTLASMASPHTLDRWSQVSAFSDMTRSGQVVTQGGSPRRRQHKAKLETALTAKNTGDTFNVEIWDPDGGRSEFLTPGTILTLYNPDRSWNARIRITGEATAVSADERVYTHPAVAEMVFGNLAAGTELVSDEYWLGLDFEKQERVGLVLARRLSTMYAHIVIRCSRYDYNEGENVAVIWGPTEHECYAVSVFKVNDGGTTKLDFSFVIKSEGVATAPFTGRVTNADGTDFIPIPGTGASALLHLHVLASRGQVEIYTSEKKEDWGTVKYQYVTDGTFMPPTESGISVLGYNGRTAKVPDADEWVGWGLDKFTVCDWTESMSLADAVVELAARGGTDVVPLPYPYPTPIATYPFGNVTLSWTGNHPTFTASAAAAEVNTNIRFHDGVIVCQSDTPYAIWRERETDASRLEIVLDTTEVTFRYSDNGAAYVIFATYPYRRGATHTGRAKVVYAGNAISLWIDGVWIGTAYHELTALENDLSTPAASHLGLRFISSGAITLEMDEAFEPVPDYLVDEGQTLQKAIASLVGRRRLSLRWGDAITFGSHQYTRDDAGMLQGRLFVLDEQYSDAVPRTSVLVRGGWHAAEARLGADRYGYRPLVVDNPDLLSRDACKREAEVILLESQQAAHQLTVEGPADLRLEPEDEATATIMGIARKVIVGAVETDYRATDTEARLAMRLETRVDDFYADLYGQLGASGDLAAFYDTHRTGDVSALAADASFTVTAALPHAGGILLALAGDPDARAGCVIAYMGPEGTLAFDGLIPTTGMVELRKGVDGRIYAAAMKKYTTVPADPVLFTRSAPGTWDGYAPPPLGSATAVVATGGVLPQSPGNTLSVLYGESNAAATNYDQNQLFAQTTDGGKTWSSPVAVFPSQGRGVWLLEHAGRLYAQIEESGSGSTLRYSSDGGSTWATLAGSPADVPRALTHDAIFFSYLVGVSDTLTDLYSITEGHLYRTHPLPATVVDAPHVIARLGGRLYLLATGGAIYRQIYPDVFDEWELHVTLPESIGALYAWEEFERLLAVGSGTNAGHYLVQP